MLTIFTALLAGGAALGPNNAAAMSQDRPAAAKSADPSQDYAMAKQASDTGDYQKAIGLLNKVVAADPRNADAYNLLGYSHRNTGELTKAAVFYRRALSIDPEHRGALEYQGELFIMQGSLTAAEENLAKLAKLCPDGCDARKELETALVKAKGGA
jgi:Flp pilus assembly protein TadD